MTGSSLLCHVAIFMTISTVKKKRDWVHYVWKKQIQKIGSGYSYRNDVKTFTVKKLEIRFFFMSATRFPSSNDVSSNSPPQLASLRGYFYSVEINPVFYFLDEPFQV